MALDVAVRGQSSAQVRVESQNGKVDSPAEESISTSSASKRSADRRGLDSKSASQVLLSWVMCRKELDVRRFASERSSTRQDLGLRRQYGMWVMRVQTVLDLEQLLPHEELRRMGKLEEWREGQKVLFVSHTWLSRTHPDSPSRVKLRLLQKLLRKMLDGQLSVTPSFWTQVAHGACHGLKVIPAKRLQEDMNDGYVWLDFASIPQADREVQAQAINSIFSYTCDATYFLVLAGPWQYEDGSARDVRAWAGRGWCLMEQLGNALSPDVKPVIVAESCTNVASHGPGGILGCSWLLNPVGQGGFTVDSDRLALGKVIADLIETRKALGLSIGTQRELAWFRLLSACKANLLHGTGYAVPSGESLDAWMKSMRFSSVHDGRSTGLTPLRFAVMAGRVDLATQLLDLKADVEAPLKHAYPEFDTVKGPNIISTACRMPDMPEMVQLLLSYRANYLKCSGGEGFHALCWACQCGNRKTIDLLIQHDVRTATTLSSWGTHAFIELAYGGHKACFEHVMATYPELAKQVLDVDRLSFGSMPVFAVAETLSDVDTLRTILAARCDPTVVKPARSMVLKMTLLGFQVAIRFMSNPDMADQYLSYVFGATPLHCAAFLGNVQASRVLIAASADINSVHSPSNMTPLHLAAMAGHEEASVVLLEARALLQVRDRTKRTAAKWAMKRGHSELAHLLEASVGG